MDVFTRQALDRKYVSHRRALVVAPPEGRASVWDVLD